METVAKCRRRKIGSTRFHVNIDVLLVKSSAEGPDREGLGVVRNLSIRGALIETHVPVTTGDRLKLELTFPNESDVLGLSEVVVRWVQAGQVGVEFLNHTPHSSRRLMMFLAAIHGAARFQCEGIKMPLLALHSEANPT